MNVMPEVKPHPSFFPLLEHRVEMYATRIKAMINTKESGLLGLWGLLAAGAALSERRAMPGRRPAGWLSRGPPGAGLQRLTPGG